MKNIILSFLICTCTVLYAKNNSLNSEVKRYGELFNKINEKRFGLKELTINKTKNPFLILSKTEDLNVTALDENLTYEPDTPTYTLNAIFENRVKINNNWYKKNDIVGDYKIIKIKNKTVILVSPNDTLKLKLSRRGKENVQITVK